MTPEPEILPPLPPLQPEDPFGQQPQPPHKSKPVEPGPTLVDAVVFFAIAICLMLAIQGGGAIVAIHWHIFGKATLKEIAVLPRFTVPIMTLSYSVIALIVWALFSRAWDRPFAEGVCWNFSTASKHFGKLVLTGAALAAVIQLASSYLPMPRELPVDAFFRTPLDAWIVAIFGTLIAPAFEELAFRGFLYPALRRWTGMIVAALLTSIPFALLHAQQLAHAASPLVMVFIVSLFLTAVRQRTGSVAASALVHATYNLSIFVVVFAASGGFTHMERLKN
ncbi:MAG TPA: CPBP family intramembrane glutamic endopeptidase [Acidobacteriaceae bacterium]|jgi:hypothetical protein|nr:CPBP family intramembrane glutamic endopeptidase [Acidobacteriaceae bacterium]